MGGEPRGEARSPFVRIPESEWVASNALAFAVRDLNPVSPGHTLVIPRRVVATWFDATREEQHALFDLVDQVKLALDAGHPMPAGYNVGFNAGEAAGQTVMHLHVHIIPRYTGDMDDPRGGVRGVIPENQKYPGLSTLHTWGARDKPFFFETFKGPSFHPKSYMFFRGAEGAVYIGSSNLSRSALQDAVEWNLRLISSEDELTCRRSPASAWI